ncbi:MAG: hypothetical protein Q4B95_00805 [Lonepinella koalarum]|nr:hypothetical protein [Lonepinella koalarum]
MTKTKEHLFSKALRRFCKLSTLIFLLVVFLLAWFGHYQLEKLLP